MQVYRCYDMKGKNLMYAWLTFAADMVNERMVWNGVGKLKASCKRKNQNIHGRNEDQVKYKISHLIHMFFR